jgi:hypothetical protein
MRAANVEILEQRKPVEYRGGGDATESGKYTAIIQDTDIVEGRLNSREHIANCGFGLVHRHYPSNVFHRRRGAGKGTGPAAVRRAACPIPTASLQRSAYAKSKEALYLSSKDAR